MLAFEMKDKVNEIIEVHGNDKSSIITVLQDIQEEYRYLPMEVLEYVSHRMDVSPSKIFGIATFYENFSLEPKGKYIIKICDGTACHVRKSIPILEALRKELSLSNKKKTTDDMLFTLETVSCLGACGLAPVITINEKVYGSMTPDSTRAVLNSLREANIDEN
jgi:NADH-quinone oxidoreductase subunit E